jgi:membrane-associated phospholipid phosphatase
MKYTIARFISFIFHPVFFTLLMPFLVTYHRTSSVFDAVEWMLFSSFFLILAVVMFFFLQPVEFLTDFDLSKKEKRPIFYSIVLLFAVLYFITAIIFKGIFFPLTIVSLGIILGIVLFELANFYLKVSIHVAVASAYVITMFVLFGIFAGIIVLWIPFVVAWSRLLLKKHTKYEILAGAVLGSLVALATFALAKILL